MMVVVGWHIYQLTHDTLAPGLIGLAEVIPYFCCALFAGYAVDHHSRRMFGVPASLMAGLNALVVATTIASVLPGDQSLSTHFWLAALFLMLSGLCDGVSVVTRTTIMQLARPDAMRGRVSAINGIFIGSSNELGAFESGMAARLMGLIPSVIFGGIMTLAAVATTAYFAPRLRKLDLHHLQ